MEVRRTIIIALLAALIVVGSYIAIPIGVVPITLQTMFVLLAAVLGGQTIGLTAVAIYLVLGAIGLPVFFGGVGGFAHFAGPTGGFLISWLVASYVVGLIVDNSFKKTKNVKETTKKNLLAIIFACIVGTLIFFLIGVPYMKVVLNISWKEALTIGLIPFLPGDLLKLVSAVILGNIFALRFREFIDKERDDKSE
jgi:biotin transport system substrate-specific component